MRNGRVRCAEDTVTTSWGDELLTHAPNPVLLGEDPERLVVGGMVTDEVGLLSTAFVQRIVELFGVDGIVVERSQNLPEIVVT